MASDTRREQTRQAELVARRDRLFNRQHRRHENFAMIAPHRSAKVTSAALSKIEGRQPDASNRNADKRWQSRAYELMEEVGELGYLMHLKASLLARCDFVPEFLDDEGNWDVLPDDERRPQRVMNALVGPQGGQTELKRQAGLHLSVAGESHLVGSPVDTGGLLWEFLSIDELTITADGKTMRRRSRSAQQEELDEAETYIARLWRPSPRFSDEPDCEVKRIRRIAEEILTLTQMVDAVAQSRLSAGLLYVPDEISFFDDDESVAVDDDEAVDPFTRELIAHMSAPIADRESAASLVPLVVRGPADMHDKIKLIDLARDIDTWAQGLRQEALSRLAQGLDTPPEMMTGLGSVNHWSGFTIDADFASKHIAPLGELLAEFLSFAYLRPMLEEFEDIDSAAAARFRLRFDMSAIAARADEAATAAKLHAEGLVSDEAYVRSSGFDPTADMPDPDELFRRQAWQLITRAPQVFAAALLPHIPGFEKVDMSLIESGGGAMGPGLDAYGGGAPGATQDAQTGMELPRTPVPGFTIGDIAGLSRTITVASDAALERALERAGAKLVTKTTKLPEIRERLRSAQKSRCLELVTKAELSTIGVSLGELFEGAWDMLSPKVGDWVATYLVEQGADKLYASDQGALAASTLCASLDEHVTERAHLGFPVGANRLRVPDAIVLRALRAVFAAPAGAVAAVGG